MKDWRPEVSKIGSEIYRYRYRRKLKDEDGADLYGEVRYLLLDIAIATAYSLPRQKVTVLHENLHALSEHVGFTLPESIIEKLSPAFFDWMLANKETIRWLIGDRPIKHIPRGKHG